MQHQEKIYSFKSAYFPRIESRVEIISIKEKEFGGYVLTIQSKLNRIFEVSPLELSSYEN